MAAWRRRLVVCGGLLVGVARAADPQVDLPAAKTAVAPAAGAALPVVAPGAVSNAAGQPDAVDAWLRHMQERNPEDYARLTKLRTEDPAAFQKALKERLEKARESRLADLPHVKAFMDAMPPEEREQFLRRLREGGGKLREEWARHNAALDKFEQEARKLVELYKKAGPEEKKKIRADLKKNISDTFELREKARQEVIQRMETQLAKLKKDADKRKADRDAIVERRLKELTAETPPAK